MSKQQKVWFQSEKFSLYFVTSNCKLDDMYNIHSIRWHKKFYSFSIHLEKPDMFWISAYNELELLKIHIKNQSVLKYFSRKSKIHRASPIFWVCDTRKNIFSSWSTISCHGIYITQVCNVRAAIWMINFCYQIGTRKVGYWYVFVCDSPFESCGLSVSVF